MSIENSIKEAVLEAVNQAVKAKFDKLATDNYSLQTRLDWTEKKLNEALVQLSSRNNDLFDNEVSGDKIDGGTITNFKSTGINDSATEQKISIANDKIVIENDVHIKGQINCDTLYYQGAVATDLDLSNSVRIRGNEVLWQDRLGNSVKSSKLTEVGILKQINVADVLTVEGGKVGINSITPGGVLGIAKDGLEIVVDVVGSTPYVGTETSDRFAIGTNREPTLFVSHDNKIGIKVKSPKEDLDVAGAIRYQGQRHFYSKHSPNSGNNERGDISWNSEPSPGKPLGWICVLSGTPGTWCEIGNVSPI